MKNLRQEFIKFLKEHDAFVPFVCNLAHEPQASYRYDTNEMTLSKYISLVAKEKGAGDLIFFSFNWDFTSQGFDYWEQLNAEWRNKVNNS